MRSFFPMDPTEPPLLDKRAVALRLHVHEQTVLEWAREGTIECIRLGFRTIRFTEEHVSRFLARASQRRTPRRKRLQRGRGWHAVRGTDESFLDGSENSENASM